MSIGDHRGNRRATSAHAGACSNGQLAKGNATWRTVQMSWMMIIDSNPQELGSPALQAIHRFGFALSFPVGETTTFAQIAKKCGRGESEVRRILRMAMTYHLFKEPKAGVVAHTAATKALAQRPLLNQWVGMWLEEMGSTLSRVTCSKMHAETDFHLANSHPSWWMR